MDWIGIKMTRERFETMSLDELIDWASENLYDVMDKECYYFANKECLKDLVIDELGNDNFGMALYIINTIYENPHDTEWYRYDYSMKNLQTLSPITDKEDIKDLIFFKDEV